MKRKPSFNILLTENIKFLDEFKKNPLMKLIKSSKMSQKKKRERMLDAIQVFSNYFQKVVMLRYVLCDDAKFSGVAYEHLQEEFTHNVSLDRDRNFRPPTWDPILEATASWFTWKMFTLDSEEKTVLIHLVMETSANMFFQAAHKVMQKYAETDYFKIHSEADEKHEQMGKNLLKNLNEEKYEKLLKIQKQGWDMLNTVCERIAKLSN